ncbi:MAG: TlpA family protein disulfide reductase [Nitrospiraceae bacterium]|nr:MAG: TlpA family protein disulfide reductase [Nitrospiraceae bacterium]
MPSLESLNRHFKNKDFVVLGIDIQEDRDTVMRYVREHGLSYHNLLDETGEVSASYGVRSTPVKFIIDADGNVAGVALGYREWDGEEMKSLIRKLMETG